MTSQVRSGICRIFDQGREAGVERWRFEPGAGALTFTSEVERTEPVPWQDLLTLRLSSDWRPRALTARVTTPDGTRRYHGRRAGDSWVSQIVAQDGSVEIVTLPFDDNTHINYFTLHTNTVTIRRLGLRPGERREIDVISIEPRRAHCDPGAATLRAPG